MRLLINIDVPDLERAIGFYEQAFGLTLRAAWGRWRKCPAPRPPSICWKGRRHAGSGRDAPAADYARHWTPVHLDVVVDDVDAAVRGLAAGARLEDPAATHA